MKQIPEKAGLARYVSYAVAGIIVLLPFHAVFTTWAGATWGHLDLFRIWKEILLVPFVILTMVIVRKRTKLLSWMHNDILTYLIILYITTQLVLGVAALSRGAVNQNALIYAWLINCRYLVFFLLCLVLTVEDEFVKRYWQRLVLIPAAVVIIFGLLQLWVLPANVLTHVGYGPKTIPAYQTVDQKPDYVRLQSTLRGPNPLGAYLVLIITALVALTFVKKKYRTATVVVIGLTSILLLFTYSRSAWLGAVFSILALGYWRFPAGKMRRNIVIGFGVVLLVAAGSVVMLRNNNIVQNTFFHSDETSTSPVSSNTARANALESGVRTLISEPFGRGPGTAGPASFRNSKPARIAENYFLQIGQEVGMVGLVLYIAIYMVIARRLWLLRSETLPLVLLASLVGLTIINMLSHAWADDTLSLLWWGLAGVALSPAYLGKRSKIAK